MLHHIFISAWTIPEACQYVDVAIQSFFMPITTAFGIAMAIKFSGLLLG